MKCLQAYENWEERWKEYYASKSWISPNGNYYKQDLSDSDYRKLTDEQKKSLGNFEKIIDEYNKGQLLNNKFLLNDEITMIEAIEFYDMFKNGIEFSDGTKLSLDDAIYSAREMRGDGGTTSDFVSWISRMIDIENNGGEIYRLVYLKDENSLNKKEPGAHWTTDKWVISDYYNDYFQQNYTQQAQGKKPYIITAKIPSGLVKFQDLSRSREQEIYIPNKNQDKIEILKIEKFDK